MRRTLVRRSEAQANFGKKHQKGEVSFILNKEVMLIKISKRAISTGQLNDSHHLHTQPIKLVVY